MYTYISICIYIYNVTQTGFRSDRLPQSSQIRRGLAPVWLPPLTHPNTPTLFTNMRECACAWEGGKESKHIHIHIHINMHTHTHTHTHTHIPTHLTRTGCSTTRRSCTNSMNLTARSLSTLSVLLPRFIRLYIYP